MSMQGQGESQPGEGVVTLDSLASQLDTSDAAPEEGESEEVAEPSEEIETEEAPPEESDEPEEEPTVTIKHDGKDVTLKQSEVMELAQKGFDYTKKTMEVAEERKAIEPIKAEAEQHRQMAEQVASEMLGRLNAVHTFLTEELGSPPPIEWAQQDAAYYLAQKELYESRKGKLAQVQQAIQQQTQEQARQRQAWVQQKAAETEKALKDTLKDWNNDKLTELSSYVGELGLNPQTAELAFLSPGFWQLADKAKAYDALLSKKAEMKPVSQLPKVHKPTANNQPPQLAKRQEAFKRYKQAPSLNTLADLL